MDDVLKTQIRTALNTGQRPSDVAHRFSVPIRTVTALAKSRHRMREMPMFESAGQVLHCAVPEKWCERPERADDARRRAASKKLTDELLKRHGLTAPKNPIIVPDSAPTGENWRGSPKSTRRRGKARP